MCSPTRSVLMLPGSCQHHIGALHSRKTPRVWSCLVPATLQLAAPMEPCGGHDQELFPRLRYSSSQQTFSPAVGMAAGAGSVQPCVGQAGPAFQPYGFHGDMRDMGTWKTNARAPVGCGGQSKPPLPSSDQDEQESLCAMSTALLLSDKPQNRARPCCDFKRNERLLMF